jgi:ABC-type nickel/cobalt efflux system permease component RcnA/ABC-type uncharacterized transport system substrate-binding protein
MRIISLLFVGFSFLFGCALCAIYTPTTYVNLQFHTQDKKIEAIDVIWRFSTEFTEQTLQNYDRNANQKFDQDELSLVLDVLLEYIQDKKYLSEIGHYVGTQNTQYIPIKPAKNSIEIKDNQLVYMYTILTQIPIENKRVIRAQFHDSGGFFNFRIDQNEPIQIAQDLWAHTNANSFVGFYEIKNSSKTTYKPPLKEVLEPSKKESSWAAFLKNKLEEYSNTLKSQLQQAHKNSSFSTLAPLVFLSFIYGLFHAAGPGHGKTLVGSYYLAKGGRWLEALWLSVQIGIIHVLGAFLLVLVSFYGIQTFVSKLLSDVTLYTTRLSATLILLIGFWMLWRHFFLSHEHDHHCGCSCCKPKTNFAIALAAGLVPCPGTVVIFILTFSLGSYLAGILSAIGMAAGMSGVIFLAAILGQKLGQSNLLAKASRTFSLFAILLLLLLGFVMLFGSL